MKRLFYLILILLLAGCEEKNHPTEKAIENQFTQGIAINYGNYYAEERVQQNVLSLDLYSKGLSLDTADQIVGTGVNLYFSDIFVPKTENTFPIGTYVSDTTGMALSFLPGMNYEGSVSGAYLLIIKEDGYSVDLIKEGNFVVTQDGDSTQIDFTLIRSNGQKYTASYKGIIDYTTPE